MPKYNKLHNSFAFGELGSHLYGRSDMKEYSQGAKSIQNFLPLAQGGLIRRPGSVNLGELLDSDNDIEESSFRTVRAHDTTILFVFNKYTSGRVALDLYSYENLTTEAIPYPIETILLSGLGEVTDVETYPLGDGAIIFSTVGDLSPLYVKITANSASSPYPYYASYTDIFYQPYATTSDIPLGIPFGPFNVSADNSVQLARGSGSTYLLTVTDSSDVDGSWEGKYIRIRVLTFDRIFEITSYNDTGDYYFCTVINPLNSSGDIEAEYTNVNDNYAISQWGGSDGYPSCVGYESNRLILGGAGGSYGDLIWFSQTDDIFHFTSQRYYDNTTGDYRTTDFTGDYVATDPFQKILGPSDRDKVTWISSQSQLLVGTSIAEYVVVTTDGTYSNTTVGTSKQTGHGGKSIQPVVIDGSTLFITKDGKTLREFIYNDDQQSYVTRTLNLLNPEIFIGTDTESAFSSISAKQMIYQSERNILWVLTSEFKLVGATIDLGSGTVAWHRQDIGTDVLSISLHDTEFGTSDLLVLTKRADSFTIESIGSDFRSPSLNNNSTELSDHPIFLDNSERLVAVESEDTWTTSVFVEGDTVSYLLDGTIIGEATVGVGGEFTTSQGGLSVIVGLPFKSRLETLPVDIATQTGNSLGDLSRNVTVDVMLNRACPFKMGSQEGDLFDETGHGNLFTGVIETSPNNGVDRDTTYIIETESPLPLGITALKLNGISYDS